MDNKVFNAINKMIKINREHKRLIDLSVSQIGIDRTRHRILMYIARCGNLPSQKALAEHFEVTPAAITLALQKLEGDGYIERKIGADNRFNEVKITEKGLEIVERTRELFSRVDDSLFKGFSGAELDSFTAYLERISENMKGKSE